MTITDFDDANLDSLHAALVTAIRLRTELRTHDEIARRLTAQGQPPGHSWTAWEVRQLVAAAFFSWPKDPTVTRH